MRKDSEVPTMPLRIRTIPHCATRKQGKTTLCPRSPVQRTSSKRRLDWQSESPSIRRDTKRSALTKRRVTFELDENRRVKTHTRRIQNRLDLEDEEIDLLWWDKRERREIMEREQDVFEVFSKCCTSYVDTVIRVWELCNDASSLSGDKHSKAVVLSNDDLEKIAAGPARGMEHDVVLSMFPGCRDDAIKSVIDTQREMAKANYKIRASAMRRRYRSYSRAASIFARGVADGDAQVAAAIHQ